MPTVKTCTSTRDAGYLLPGPGSNSPDPFLPRHPFIQLDGHLTQPRQDPKMAHAELARSWKAKDVQLLAGSVPKLLLGVRADEEQAPPRLISHC